MKVYLLNIVENSMSKGEIAPPKLTVLFYQYAVLSNNSSQLLLPLILTEPPLNQSAKRGQEIEE